MEIINLPLYKLTEKVLSKIIVEAYIFIIISSICCLNENTC
jgi:hypothetical protein